MKIGFPIKDPEYYGNEWVSPEAMAGPEDKKFGLYLKDDFTVKIDIEPHLGFIERVVASDTFQGREEILNQILVTNIDPFLQIAAALKTITTRSNKPRTRNLEYTNEDISHKILVDAVNCLGISGAECVNLRRERETHMEPIQFMGGEVYDYKTFIGTASFSEAVMEAEDLWGKIGTKVSADISEKIKWKILPILTLAAPERWEKEYLVNSARSLVRNEKLISNPGGTVIKDFEHCFLTDMVAGRIGGANDFMEGNPENLFTGQGYYTRVQGLSRGTHRRLSSVCPLSTFMLSIPPDAIAEEISTNYDVHAGAATFIHSFSPTTARNHKDVIESIRYVDLSISKYLLSMPGFVGSMQDMMLIHALRAAIYLEYMDDSSETNETALHALMRKRDEMILPIYDKEWQQNHSCGYHHVENCYSKMTSENLRELSLHVHHLHGGKLWNYERDYSLQPMKRLQAG